MVERALDVLLAELARQKFAETDRPGVSRATSAGSRHVPAAVRRAVWLRDRGRCAFVSRAGHRCNERKLVEFHHRHPHALGGPPTVDNISLRCRAHNAYEARVDFGSVPERIGPRPVARV